MFIRRHLATITCILALTVVNGVGFADQDDTLRTDDAIQKAIAEHFDEDETLRGRDVSVKVSNGIAMLDGPVASLYEQERAAQIASTLKGVRAVVNTTTIKSDTRPDGELTTDIVRALTRDPATESFEVDVKAVGGAVTLIGIVDSYSEKLLAGQVAKNIRGVHELKNELQVRPDYQRSDKVIDAEITRRLESDAWVDHRLVRVLVDDGHVRLQGVAGTLAEKDAAEIAAWVAGVKSVDVSELKVDWKSLDQARRESPFAVRANYQIKDALADAFRLDPRVNRFAIDIDILAATVVLSGEVHNLAAKRAAEQDAYNTVGVTKVDNRLHVTVPQRREDGELAEALQAALARDSISSVGEIRVSVNDAVATLAGEVDSAFVKQRAEAIASRVRRLRDIDNEIEVAERGRIVSDLDLKYSIKNRMYWSGYMDSREIVVRVDQGIVTLTGEVDSRSAFDMATKMAVDAGAKEVRNRLLIRDVVMGS
ncbi:MAG: BON domain-containing protein [Planctomycetales bacterium]|nr:BON domain-containing protein [Planctomycetales bacterium]